MPVTPSNSKKESNKMADLVSGIVERIRVEDVKINAPFQNKETVGV